MHPVLIERVRAHRRILASRWSAFIVGAPSANPWWRDAERTDHFMLAGLDALIEAASSGSAESFVAFASRLSQDAFAGHVPSNDVIRAILAGKAVITEFLTDPQASPALDVATVQSLDQIVSAGLLEGIRRQERQRERRLLTAQEQLEQLRDRLRRQVVVDSPTGLYNANYFSIAVRREVRRSQRFGRVFSLALVALDQDDDVRESSGEEGLRTVTITLADILTRSTRQIDLRAALGDVRFGLILPETPMDGAFVLAERIRVAVEQHAFILPDHPSPLARTVSIGLASFPRDAEDDRGLLARLHEALARARSGGNTTVASVSTPNT
jgi:diguanylate cyclase (GGDEF)-like protein